MHDIQLDNFKIWLTSRFKDSMKEAMKEALREVEREKPSHFDEISPKAKKLK